MANKAQAYVPTTFAVMSYASIALSAFEMILPLMPKKERKNAGGTFALTDKNGVPHFGFPVGRSLKSKRAGRWRRAFEKSARAARLAHKTSRQSRNPKEDKWAGSLWCSLGQVRGSFSGFPEDWDEIFVATVLLGSHDMSLAEAFRQLENNKTFQRVRERLWWAKKR